jgi:zinc protease
MIATISWFALALGSAWGAPTVGGAPRGDLEPPAPSPSGSPGGGPDRSRPPAVLPSEPLPLPEPTLRAVAPGVTLHHVHVPGLRKVRVDVLFRRGALDVDGRESAAFTAMGWLQDQRTRGYSEGRVTEVQALHDLDVWTEAHLQSTTARLEAPLDALDEGLALLRDVIVAPRYARADLRLLRQNYLRMLLHDGPTRAGTLLDAGLTYGWFAPEHPFGARPDVAGWHRVRVRHLDDRHRAVLASAPVDVVVVGDLSLDAAVPRVARLVERLGAPGDPPAPIRHDPAPSARVIAVDFSNTTQAALGVRFGAPRFDDPDSPAFVLLDHAVGGTFLSRLNRELREARGLTYGIGSDLTTAVGHGHWTITTEVRVDRLGEALDAVLEIVGGVAADGLTDAELADGATAAVQRWNRTLATVGSAAAVYGARVLNGRDGDTLSRRLDATRAVTPEASRAAAARWLGPDAPRLIVVIGARERLEPMLAERGLQATWMPAGLLILGGP